MRILALDLSLSATGLCFPDYGLSTFVPRLQGDYRLDEIAAAVRNITEARGVQLVVMEDVPFGHNPSAGPLSLVHGAVRLQLIRKRIPYVTIPPASLKKYATGKGNATKPDMRMAWFNRAGVDVRDDNQVDAAFLHAMASDHYGEPRFTMPAIHRAAIEKIRWPEFDQPEPEIPQ